MGCRSIVGVCPPPSSQHRALDGILLCRGSRRRSTTTLFLVAVSQLCIGTSRPGLYLEVVEWRRLGGGGGRAGMVTSLKLGGAMGPDSRCNRRWPWVLKRPTWRHHEQYDALGRAPASSAELGRSRHRLGVRVVATGPSAAPTRVWFLFPHQGGDVAAGSGTLSPGIGRGWRVAGSGLRLNQALLLHWVT